MGRNEILFSLLGFWIILLVIGLIVKIKIALYFLPIIMVFTVMYFGYCTVSLIKEKDQKNVDE